MSNFAGKSLWISRWAIVVLAAFWLLMFIATHVPLSLPPSAGNYNDKIAHFSAYLLLALLMSAALATRATVTWRRLLIVLAIAAVYGVIDELLQLLIPGRSAEFYDWVADCFGAASGVVFCGLVHAWWNR